MGAAVEENPVVRAEELVRGIDDAGLDEGGRVEDLARHVAGRGNDHKSDACISIFGVYDQLI
jgi:hypothetical protein